MYIKVTSQATPFNSKQTKQISPSPTHVKDLSLSWKGDRQTSMLPTGSSLEYSDNISACS